jgi:hypothetical protein
MSPRTYPLITRDPASGGEMVVTRLESTESGTVLEGRFSLGWVGKLTPEQLDFVGLLLKHRNNLQKLANDLGVAYNTARVRLDEVVAALGGEAEQEKDRKVEEVIGKLSSKEMSFEDAMKELKGRRS